MFSSHITRLNSTNVDPMIPGPTEVMEITIEYQLRWFGVLGKVGTRLPNWTPVYPHEAPPGYPIDKAIDICGCLKLVTTSRDTQKFYGEYHIFPYKEIAIKLESKPPWWDKPISSHVHYSILKSELLIVTPACFTIILLNHRFMCFFQGQEPLFPQDLSPSQHWRWSTEFVAAGKPPQPFLAGVLSHMMFFPKIVVPQIPKNHPKFMFITGKINGLGYCRYPYFRKTSISSQASV